MISRGLNAKKGRGRRISGASTVQSSGFEDYGFNIPSALRLFPGVFCGIYSSHPNKKATADPQISTGFNLDR